MTGSLALGDRLPSGGPAGATATTLAAPGRPILHHLDPAFGALYAETVELLRRAFEAGPSPVIALTAIGRALRALGAKADIGAAVEAAVTALGT